MFPAHVAAWRELAASEARGIPVDLVLAFVLRESNGKAGRVGYTDTGSRYTEAERACGLPAQLAARALGLIQAAPSVLRTYNQTAKEKITPCDLAGASLEAARRQLRIGCWLLRQCLEATRELDPIAHPWPGGELSDSQIVLARLMYHKGREGLRRQLERAAARGFPRTAAGLERYDPAWGAPDHPFDGARGVLAAYRAASGPGSGPGGPARPGGPGRPGSGPGGPASPGRSSAGFGLAGLALLFGLWWWWRSRSREAEA